MAETMPATVNHRVSLRKATFVAAHLQVGTASLPVKIRNLSTKGALLEAASFPPAGTAILLVRGPLSAKGRISWADSGRGGVEFDGSISVEDWIRGKVPEHQVRVDAMIAQIRLAGMEPRSLHAAAPPASLDLSIEPIENELRALASLITGLEDALTDDPQVIARHGEALQRIDEAQQRIAALVRRMST